MRTMFLLLILVGVMGGSSAKAQDAAADKPATQPAAASITTPAISQEQVVAEIEKCGATVKRDGNAPDGAVVEVIFDRKSSQGVTEAGLEHLEGLKELRTLNLANTKVTDGGLEHLKGLSQLVTLNLGCTNVTDEGLAKLKGLNRLENLNLLITKVSDAGLAHLEGLSQLRSLSVYGSRVTSDGVKKLQQALPRCKIER